MGRCKALGSGPAVCRGGWSWQLYLGWLVNEANMNDKTPKKNGLSVWQWLLIVLLGVGIFVSRVVN